MLYLAVKASLSGVIIAVISEVARRSPTLDAHIVSLPLVSILGTFGRGMIPATRNRSPRTRDHLGAGEIRSDIVMQCKNLCAM